MYLKYILILMKEIRVLLVLCLTVANAAVSLSCLKNSPTFYGVSGGTAFSDYVYLVQNESANWYYRLITVMLCTDSNGNLNGMQAKVGMYSQIDGGILDHINSNIAGNVSGFC